MARRQKPAEYHTGTDAAKRAEDALGRLLRVPKTELDRREADYQESRRTTRTTRTPRHSTTK